MKTPEFEFDVFWILFLVGRKNTLDLVWKYIQILRNFQIVWPLKAWNLTWSNFIRFQYFLFAGMVQGPRKEGRFNGWCLDSELLCFDVNKVSVVLVFKIVCWCNFLIFQKGWEWGLWEAGSSGSDLFLYPPLTPCSDPPKPDHPSDWCPWA